MLSTSPSIAHSQTNCAGGRDALYSAPWHVALARREGRTPRCMRWYARGCGDRKSVVPLRLAVSNKIDCAFLEMEE